MPFHVKFDWQQQSSKLGGWGMGFWNSLSDLSAATAKADALRDRINAITGIQVVCPSYSISDITTTRNVQNVVVNSLPGTNITPANDADYPSTALLLKVSASGNYKTEQWIRGIPDANISSSGRYNPQAQYANRMAAFFGELTSAGNGWSLYSLDKGRAKKVITALDVTTGIVTCPAHGFGAAGSTLKVRVQGFQSPKAANKIWRIVVIDPNTFQLSFWKPLTGVTVSGNNPLARPQTYTMLQITLAAIVRATSHYTGRPTGLLGGRRRRRQTV